MSQWILHSAFGLVVLHFVIQKLRQWRSVSQLQATLLFLAWILIQFMCSSLNIISLFLSSLLLLFYIFASSLLLEIHARRWNQTFLVLLDEISLGLKSGQSFRHSWAALSVPPWFLKVIEEKRKRHPNHEIVQKWDEFESLSRETFKIADRLKSLRQNLAIMEKFRRKSRSALAQQKLQMIVLTLLYLTIGGFLVLIGRIPSPNWLFISLTLFLAGALLFYVMTRKRKWKS